MLVNYQVKGSSDGKPIVLLHGWGGSIDSLDELQEILASAGYNVYNLDLPGFGESATVTTELQMEDYVNYLNRFLQELKIDKPILVGHSFGGKLAMAFCLQHPLLVSKLVLINASGLNPHKSAKRGLLYLPTKIGGKVFSLPILGFFKNAVRYLYYKVIVKENDYLKASPEMRKTMQNILKVNYDDKVQNITQPTLLIWGEKDTATPLYMGQKLSSYIPNARLEVIQNATHGLPLKQPALVAGLMYSFLQN